MTKRILCQGTLAGLFGIVAVAVACSKGDGGSGFDKNCESCRKDGESCEVSDNCAPGSICNDPSVEFYDSAKASATCVKVVCDSSADCEAPKTCGLEKVCSAPVCQIDADCQGGLRCIAGACQAAPGLDTVASCEIMTRNGIVRESATVELAAIAKDSRGIVVPSIGFDWVSSSPEAVAINGQVARGGAQAGRAMISASVTGKPSVACGAIAMTSYGAVAPGNVRVVLVEADTGLPIQGAAITMIAGGSTLSGSTSMDGAATVATASTIDSITIVSPGHQYVTILEPTTTDIMVPVPREDDETKAGGFRGAVDISSTRRADIQLGIAGPVIPPNLLDFSFQTIIGDPVKTILDAPELGLKNQDVDLPGGIMLGLGNKRFTSDGAGLRCQGAMPAQGELGCYIARAAAGRTAAWTAGGQLKIAQVAGLAGTLKDVLGGDKSMMTALPIGDILTSVLPLVRTLNHGVLASLEVSEHPKVNVNDGTTNGCADPSVPNYKENCRGDYAKYDQIKLAAAQKFSVLSRVSVPELPKLPNGRCAGAAVVISAAVLPGRGVLPLGLSAGVDVIEKGQPADCKVNGVEEPFGANSPKLADGQIPLSMAPNHSGTEGSKVALIVAALDPNTLVSGVQLSAIVQRVPSVSEVQTVGGTYLPFPQGSLSRAHASFRFREEVTGATATRLEIQRGSRTWLVYAPGNRREIALPNVAMPREVLGDVTDMFVQALKIDGAYGDMWNFGSGKTLDRVVDNVSAFALQQCKSTDAPCTIAAEE